jgi:hypothetical protein
MNRLLPALSAILAGCVLQLPTGDLTGLVKTSLPSASPPAQPQASASPTPIASSTKPPPGPDEARKQREQTDRVHNEVRHPKTPAYFQDDAAPLGSNVVYHCHDYTYPEHGHAPDLRCKPPSW